MVGFEIHCLGLRAKGKEDILSKMQVPQGPQGHSVQKGQRQKDRLRKPQIQD